MQPDIFLSEVEAKILDHVERGVEEYTKSSGIVVQHLLKAIDISPQEFQKAKSFLQTFHLISIDPIALKGKEEERQYVLYISPQGVNAIRKHRRENQVGE